MPAAPLATTTAFVYVGGALAAWAVVLSAIGFSRRDFPGKDGAGQRLVILFTALLVVASIATAIGTAEEGPHPTSATAAAHPSAAPPPATSTPAPAGGAAQQLSLSADPTGQLHFNTNSLSAKAGAVKITLTNPAPLAHNISLQGPGGVNLQGATVPKGGTSTVSATLKAGTYTFYCSVPGHRQAGMQGTLTVR